MKSRQRRKGAARETESDRAAIYMIFVLRCNNQGNKRRHWPERIEIFEACHAHHCQSLRHVSRPNEFVGRIVVLFVARLRCSSIVLFFAVFSVGVRALISSARARARVCAGVLCAYDGRVSADSYFNFENFSKTRQLASCTLYL